MQTKKSMVSLLLLQFVAAGCYVHTEGLSSRGSLRISSATTAYKKTFLPAQPKRVSVILRENKKDYLGQIMSKLSDIITSPTEIPLQNNRKLNAAPLGYLLIIGLLNIFVLPLFTALLLDALFTTYFFFGRSIFYENDEDEDDSAMLAVTDLISLAGSLFTAGLISPQGFYHPDHSEISFISVCVSILLYTSLIVKVIPDSDLKREYQKFLTFGDWDKKFSKKD